MEPVINESGKVTHLKVQDIVDGTVVDILMDIDDAKHDSSHMNSYRVRNLYKVNTQNRYAPLTGNSKEYIDTGGKRKNATSPPVTPKKKPHTVLDVSSGSEIESEDSKTTVSSMYTEKTMTSTDRSEKSNASTEKEPENGAPVQANTRAQKSFRPPPIHFIGIHLEEHNKMVKLIKEITVDFHIQHKHSVGETLLYFRSMEHYATFKTRYQEILPFYTYTPKSEKSFAYIIKGLSDDTNVEELTAELQQKNLLIKNIHKFKNTRLPTYMCTLKKYETLDNLKKNVRFLNYTRVFWENYSNKRGMVQCKKCQTWGHVTTNCYLKVTRCVKCAGDHLSYQCTKSRDVPAKCCNCGGEHPASSIDCVCYMEAMGRRAKETERQVAASARQPKLFAPAPTTNPWGRKRKEDFPALPQTTNYAFSSQPTAPVPQPQPQIQPQHQERQQQPQQQQAPQQNPGGGEMGEMLSIWSSLKEVFKLIDIPKLKGTIRRLKEHLQNGGQLLVFLIEEMANGP